MSLHNALLVYSWPIYLELCWKHFQLNHYHEESMPSCKKWSCQANVITRMQFIHVPGSILLRIQWMKLITIIQVVHPSSYTSYYSSSALSPGTSNKRIHFIELLYGPACKTLFSNKWFLMTCVSTLTNPSGYFQFHKNKHNFNTSSASLCWLANKPDKQSCFLISLSSQSEFLLLKFVVSNMNKNQYSQNLVGKEKQQPLQR